LKIEMQRIFATPVVSWVVAVLFAVSVAASAIFSLRAMSLSRRHDALIGLYHRVVAEADSLQRELVGAQLTLEGMQRDRYYLVIDREGFRFQLRKGDVLVREGNCAVGRGNRSLRGQVMKWETPAGERIVRDVEVYPHWRRPDWFWWERGLEVPDTFLVCPEDLTPSEEISWFRSLPEDQQLLVRSVPGKLGRFKVDLGGGVLIHLGGGRGRAVSHGCIRVSWDDLDALVACLKVGDSVFIY
jgi:hypothetical protein